MRRLHLAGFSYLLPFVLFAAAAACSGCSTYRDDLDRAITHYNARAYDRALALFEVLEPDIDSLSPAERAQYSYYRGMSHLLLEQKADARHWLGLAEAREKAQKGSLNPDEKKRADDSLVELNKAKWGDATTPTTLSCEGDADCDPGQFCEAGTCQDTKEKKDADAKEPEAAPPKEEAPPAPADKGGTKP
jgi:hypothetical protein